MYLTINTFVFIVKLALCYGYSRLYKTNIEYDYTNIN